MRFLLLGIVVGFVSCVSCGDKLPGTLGGRCFSTTSGCDEDLTCDTASNTCVNTNVLSDGGCAPGRSCNAACSAVVPCTGSTMCIDGRCGRAKPTSTAYAVCALDADCPRGDHCSIGVCSHECLADKECQNNTVCSFRGRCVAVEAVAQPLPTPKISKGVPNVSASVLDFGADTSALSLTLSNSGGEPFDFRILSNNPAYSVMPAEGRVSGASVNLSVTVDRTKLAAQTDGVIAVNTSAGNRSVVASSAVPLDGQWNGSFDVTKPITLGRHAASMNLSVAGTELSGLVLGDVSPIWPVNARISGSVGAEIVVTFRIVAPTGTAANPAVPATLGRTVTITGKQTESGLITGTYTEVIKGLSGADIEIGGNVALRRAGIFRVANPVADSTLPVEAPPDPFVDADTTWAVSGLQQLSEWGLHGQRD
jgi:hypothetical protein